MSDFDEDEFAGGAEPLDLFGEDEFAGLPDELVEGEGPEGLIPGIHIDGEDDLLGLGLGEGEGEDDEAPEPLF